MARLDHDRANRHDRYLEDVSEWWDNESRAYEGLPTARFQSETWKPSKKQKSKKTKNQSTQTQAPVSSAKPPQNQPNQKSRVIEKPKHHEDKPSIESLASPIRGFLKSLDKNLILQLAPEVGTIRYRQGSKRRVISRDLKIKITLYLSRSGYRYIRYESNDEIILFDPRKRAS